MYQLKKNGNVSTSKFVGTGPSSYEKRIYRAAVSQWLRNTGVEQFIIVSLEVNLYHLCRIRNKTIINSLYFGFTHDTHNQLLFLLTYYFGISPYNVNRICSM